MHVPISKLQYFLKIAPIESQNIASKLSGEFMGSYLDASLPRIIFRVFRLLYHSMKNSNRSLPATIVLTGQNHVKAEYLQKYLALYEITDSFESGSIQKFTRLDFRTFLIVGIEFMRWFVLYLGSKQVQKKYIRPALYPHIISILAMNSIQYNKVQKVIFWGHLYRPELYLLGLKLFHTETITSVAYNAGVILFRPLSFSADKIIYSSPWQAVADRQAKTMCFSLEQAGYTESFLENHKKLAACGDEKTSLAVYSSAMWIRDQYSTHSTEFIARLLTAENKMHSFVRFLLQSNCIQSATIYLHPHELKDSSKTECETYYKGQYQEQYNRLVFGEKNIKSADEYGCHTMGIGVISTTLFERLELGLKSVLFAFDEFAPEYKSTAIKHLILPADFEAASQQFENLMTMKIDDFQRLIQQE